MPCCETERNVQLQASLSSVRQELHTAREAGEASKKKLAVYEGTAGDCKKRCDALQASQRDAGKELSGVVEWLAWAVSAGAQDADTIRQLEDELKAGRATCLAGRADLGCSLAFESERNVQPETSLSSVQQEFQKAREAGESVKKQLAESANTAGVCKKRCDTQQACQRDAGKELSGVEERLAWAVSAGAKDADTIRLLEDELEAGRAQWLAVKAELGGSLAFESERNVQLQASLSSVRQEFLNARKPVKRRRSSC
jgi:chromosome segregation ATPase